MMTNFRTFDVKFGSGGSSAPFFAFLGFLVLIAALVYWFNRRSERPEIETGASFSASSGKPGPPLA